MPHKFKATLNKEGSGAYVDVYAEANSQIEAEQILQAQYPGHRIIGTHKVEEQSETSSSNSGCASVLAMCALLPLGYAVLQVAI